MEGFKVADANLVVCIHPSKAKKVSEALLSELSSLLFKFNETFDGVLLAYDVNILGNLAKILPGIHPYFGARLKSKLLLFYPKPDMLLEGKVVKLSQQSIHVIVLSFTSAIIIEEDIREEFKYKIEVCVSTIHKQHKIKVGTILRFIVKRYQRTYCGNYLCSFYEEMLHICGSLLPTNMGSACWLHTNSEDWLQAERLLSKLHSANGI